MPQDEKGKGSPFPVSLSFLWVCSHSLRNSSEIAQPMNPRLLVGKLTRLGKIVGKFALLTPNHVAIVAAYWSRAVVGIQRPLLPATSGPPSASVGKFPYTVFPFTAPPRTTWWFPHAWSVPPFVPG